MPEQTCINVPVGHVAWITEALTRAGITVLDTGERVTTEDDLAGEAVLCVARLAETAEVSISEALLTE